MPLLLSSTFVYVATFQRTCTVTAYEYISICYSSFVVYHLLIVIVGSKHVIKSDENNAFSVQIPVTIIL
jgi:hypothetical protein